MEAEKQEQIFSNSVTKSCKHKIPVPPFLDYYVIHSISIRLPLSDAGTKLLFCNTVNESDVNFAESPKHH